MQDRYAGDVGDFGKFALLRALAPGRRVGVCWYRWSGDGERNNDGKHTAYLDRPAQFRTLDPVAFDAMRGIVRSGRRSVAALERCALVPGARYHGAPVPARAADRASWFAGALRATDGCDLVCTDPDNGFEWSQRGPKCIWRDEVRALRRRGRALVLYHHQTRRAGGAAADYERFATWLFETGARSVEGIRLRPYSSRFYLVVEADRVLSAALRAFAARWGDRAELFARRTRD